VEVGQAGSVAAEVPEPGLFPDDYSAPADSVLAEWALDDCSAALREDDRSALEVPPDGCWTQAGSA